MSKITLGDVRYLLDINQIVSCGGYSEEGYEDFSYFTPCGEDFIFTLRHDDNAESLSEALTKYAESFDPEDHAVNWYNHQKDTVGVPESLKDLLEDAENIKTTLVDAAKEISCAVEHGISSNRIFDDAFLNLMVEILLREEDGYFEVLRDAYDRVVKADSYNGKYTIQIRFKGKIFDVSISDGEEVL